MTKIKICGLFRPEDIEAVNLYQSDYAGFIINFPKSHRNISPAVLKQLKSKLDPRIKSVGVFVDRPLKEVRNLLEEGIIDIAQLHGSEDSDYIKALQMGGYEVWKAFEIQDRSDLERAIESPADKILLDAGKGQGRTFSWDILSGLKMDYILAGGLHSGNVEQAIRSLHPLGLDISSGVESDGLKDAKKIEEVIRIVRGIQ